MLAYQSFVQHVHREEDLDQPAFHGLSAPLMQDLQPFSLGKAFENDEQYMFLMVLKVFLGYFRASKAIFQGV